MDVTSFNISYLSPTLFFTLLVINLLLPSYMQNKDYEVSAFRYLLFFSPAVFTLSWILILKSLLLGMSAAIVWKTYYNSFPIREAPNNFGILWIVLELTMLCLNLGICLLFTNCDFLTRTPNAVYLALFLRCYIGPACLILLRPPYYYLENFNQIIDVNFANLHLKEILVFLLIIVYTAFEYIIVIYHKDLEMEFNDADISNLTFCAIASITGRLTAGILTKDLIEGNIPLRYAHFIQVLACALLLQIVPRKMNACTDSTKETFAQIETLVPMILLGFGDACYARHYDNLSIEFIDRSSEALVLVKYGEILIIGVAGAFANVGYKIGFSLFFYLCTLNIQLGELVQNEDLAALT